MHKLKWHIIVCNFWLLCACSFSSDPPQVPELIHSVPSIASPFASGVAECPGGCRLSMQYSRRVRRHNKRDSLYLETGQDLGCTSPRTSHNDSGNFHLMQARNWELRGYLYKKLQCLCVVSKKSLSWTLCACHSWISVCLSVCLSGLMFSLRNCSTDFHDIWH